MLSNRARLIFRTVVLTLAGTGLVGAIVGVVVLRGGFYDISANTQHFPIVYKVFTQGLQYSVQYHAKDIQVPENLGGREQLLRGASLYQANCVQCHGGPAVAPLTQGMSMQPAPGPLVDADVNWKTRELYWITRNGIKMSGMPSWQYHLSEQEIWDVVAFVAAMPTMTPADYQRMTRQEGVTEQALESAHTTNAREES